MIPLFKVYMHDDVVARVGEVLTSGYVGQGPVVERFEAALRARFFTDYVLTVNSATSAEHLVLHLLKKVDVRNGWPGMTEKDEVLTSPLTCTATNWPVLANGLRIKWVDVDENTLNIDLEDLTRKLSPATKIIYFVHWGGYPVDLDRIKEIQNIAYSLYGSRPVVIEDCAHAFGSTYKGKPIGSHGNICTFSFQAIKHLTCVDGGALIVPDGDLYRRGKLLRWYGIDRETNRKDFRCETDIPEWGYKFHMNDVNAMMGLTNLETVDETIQRRQANAQYYDETLAGVDGVTLLENAPDRKSAAWLYSMKVERQEDFRRYMTECGVAVSRVHERNDIHTCVREFKTSLPNLDRLSKCVMCIPNGWWVTDENREYIVACIKKGW